MEFLADVQHFFNSSEDFVVETKEPVILPVFGLYDAGYHGHITKTNYDLMYCRGDYYHAMVREDTEILSYNELDDGLNFAFNRWYYLTQGNGYLYQLAGDAKLFSCNPNHYYILKTSGRIPPEPQYNELSLDLSEPQNSTLFFVLEESIDKTTWQQVTKWQIPLTNGAFRLENSVMVKAVSHRYYRFKIELDVYPTGEINAENDYTLFTMSAQMIRKPRLSWKQRYSLSPILASANSENIYTLPSDNELILPWEGVYQVSAYATTIEADAADIPVNCASPQGLYLSGNGSSYFSIDTSGTGDGGPSAPDFFWAPNSLQGTSFVQVLSNRTIKVMVFLPNGIKKSVTGGYVDVQFVGDLYSPSYIAQ